MAETFTPGPWEPGGTVQNDGGLAVLVTRSRDRIAKAWAGSDGSTAKANARLIAAAPEMHALLVHVADMETYGYLGEALEDIRDLLKRIREPKP